MTWKTIGHLFCTVSSFVHHCKGISEFKLESQSGDAQFGSKSIWFVPCDLGIWQMILKNNRAPLCQFKLLVSFRNNRWIQTQVTVRERYIQVEIDDFDPCGLETWQTTLNKNNKAHLLYYFKLSASFHRHRWIKTRVTVRKHPIRVKIGDFFSTVSLKCDGWPPKTIGHLFYMYAISSFVHHFIVIYSNWSYGPETGQTVKYIYDAQFKNGSINSRYWHCSVSEKYGGIYFFRLG